MKIKQTPSFFILEVRKRFAKDIMQTF